MKLQEHYQTSVLNSLGGYQLLEQLLKQYLEMYYETVQMIVGDRLAFNLNGKDFSNAPLGALQKAFSKTTNNADLAKKIKALVSHRDHIAHLALNCLWDESTSTEKYTQMTEENLKVIREIREIHQAVLQEMRKMTLVMKEAELGPRA